MRNIDEFLSLNRAVAAQNLLWVQGPGGNTSMKAGEILYVKPSGTRIYEMQAIENFASLDGNEVRLALQTIAQKPDRENAYKQLIEVNTFAHSSRPSMESGFHAYLPQTFVFHFHSLLAVVMADYAHKNSSVFNEWYQREWAQKLGPLALIESCLPGLELTLAIARAPASSIYWLINHGTVLAFEEPDFLQSYLEFEEACLKQFLPEHHQFVRSLYQLSAIEIARIKPDLTTAKLKFYFPDLAIIYSRLAKYLAPNNGAFTFAIAEAPRDLDAFENWLACSVLQCLARELPELPASMIAAIPELPTEIARKKIMES